MTENSLIPGKKWNIGDFIHFLEIAALLISIGVNYGRFTQIEEEVSTHTRALQRIADATPTNIGRIRSDGAICTSATRRRKAGVRRSRRGRDTGNAGREGSSLIGPAYRRLRIHVTAEFTTSRASKVANSAVTSGN